MKQRELQFENEHIRVWKAEISSDQPLDTHRNDTGRLLISLRSGELQQVNKNGASSNLKLERHQTCWLKPGQSSKVDAGSEPVEVMIVEMKKAKERPLPSKPID